MRTASILLLVAACALVSGAAAAGPEKSHRVAAGESASAIAKRYYGDFELAPLLLAYNGKQGTVVRAGETLRIPACAEHRVRAGDAWSVLARRYLGRADAWPVVARLNGLLPEQPLRPGQRIVFPVVLRHELRRGETLAVLAERYYGDGRQGDLLRDFNSVGDPRRLAVGQTIEVPLVAFRLAPAPEARAGSDAAPPELAANQEPAPEPAAVAEAPAPRQEPPPPAAPALPQPVPEVLPAPPPEPDRRFAEPLHEAALALAHGRFDDVRERLAALRGPVGEQGTSKDRAELWRLFFALHVAYDEDGPACDAYRSLAALAPGDNDDNADPNLVSPKIRAMIEHCTAHGS